MKTKLLLFGVLSEITKTSSITVDLAMDTNQLRKLLSASFPDFDNTNYVIAINKKVTVGNHAINDGDEIAILPPFAGG